MQKQSSFTFIKPGNTSLTSLLELETKILEDYNRIYNTSGSVEMDNSNSGQCKMILQEISKEDQKDFQQQFLKFYPRHFLLKECSFYEMFTIVIFQYLLNDINGNKEGIINDLKWMIYSDSFLQNQRYTKGLIAKGFKLLQKAVQNSNSPVFHQEKKLIAQCLISQNILRAFSQCWKELVYKTCIDYDMRPIKPNNYESAIDILSSHFMIDISLYKRKGKKISYLTRNSHSTPISIIMEQSEQKQIKSYLIFTKDSSFSFSQSKKVLPNMPQIPKKMAENPEENDKKLSQIQEISRIEDKQCSEYENEDIKLILDHKLLDATSARRSSVLNQLKQKKKIDKILENIHNTMNKGDQLIKNMKQYLASLQ